MISDLILMFRLITEEEIILATWWHHCPSYPDDHPHNTRTPDPRPYLITARMNERHLSKAGNEKQRDWTPAFSLNSSEAFHPHDGDLSPADLVMLRWFCDRNGEFKCFFENGIFNKYSKRWWGRAHFPVDVQLASLITHSSCYRAVIKVIWDIGVVLC